jgi:glycosyltransferase involved in cell wall biosynthesis
MQKTGSCKGLVRWVNPTERTVMTRILFILPGLVPPASNPIRNRFHYLSEICEGEVLLPVWWRSASQVRVDLKQSFPVHRVGRFAYRLLLLYRFPRVFRKPAVFLWYVTRGIQLHREGKIEVIVTYGTNMPAVAGTVLKWLTGAKLIVEIPGAPENAFRYHVPNPGIVDSVKHFIADFLLLFVGRASDCLKLFYPWQLKEYPSLQKKHVAIFHDFVPVRCVELPEEENEKYILCVGYPWYTKGVDILIRAFKEIVKQYPDFKLKLMGHYPDRHVLEELAGDCPQIEFLAPRPNELALKVISACTIYVSASRTEGLPWVVLEAMAAGRPIIASNVGGMAHCIRDGENGLLFPSENVDELAAKMVHLLNHEELRARLGQKGHDRVFSEFDEVAYVREFKKMLEGVSKLGAGP